MALVALGPDSWARHPLHFIHLILCFCNNYLLLVLPGWGGVVLQLCSCVRTVLFWVMLRRGWYSDRILLCYFAKLLLHRLLLNFWVEGCARLGELRPALWEVWVGVAGRDWELILVLWLELTELRDTCHARDGEFDYRLSLPIMDPFLLPVKFIEDEVYLGEGTILNFGSLFMSGTVLYVVQVVLVGLHAYLAVCVLFIWDGFKDVFIYPWLNIIISFISSLLIFVILTGSSFFNSIKIFNDKFLFSLGDARTIAIWSFFNELMDVILRAH